MKLLASQLQQHLSKGLAPLYVLVGDEPLGQMECLDAIRRSARQNGVEERTALTTDRYFDWSKIVAYGQEMSLFASLRLLEINIPNGKPGIDGSKALQALADSPMSDTITVIILPTIDWRDAKSAWYMALEQKSILITLQDIDASKLALWIANRLTLQKQSTDQETLSFIANQVEGNLLAAHQEIQKLGLLFPQGNIDAEHVRSAVLNVSRFDAVQLGEAVLLGDIDRTTRILDGLQDEGAQPIAVMNPLIWAIKPLVKVKLAESRGESLNTAMRDAKLFYEKEALARRVLPRLSLKQLQAALLKLADIDKIGKGIMQGDAWLEISRLCFGLARISARARSRS
jgi:DNA polymerase-3 subunit delta